MLPMARISLTGYQSAVMSVDAFSGLETETIGVPLIVFASRCKQV